MAWSSSDEGLGAVSSQTQRNVNATLTQAARSTQEIEAFLSACVGRFRSLRCVKFYASTLRAFAFDWKPHLTVSNVLWCLTAGAVTTFLQPYHLLLNQYFYTSINLTNILCMPCGIVLVPRTVFTFSNVSLHECLIWNFHHIVSKTELCYSGQ